MRYQSQPLLLTTLGLSLHSTPEREDVRSPFTLPPPTLDERSRELRTQSTLLRWRAQYACAHSRHLRERIEATTQASRGHLTKFVTITLDDLEKKPRTSSHASTVPVSARGLQET